MPNTIRPENAHPAHPGRSFVRHALTAILLICSIGAIKVTAATGSGPNYAQAAAGAVHTAASSLSVAFPNSTVAGNVILVGFDYATTASPSSVTDSQGNTFTEVGSPLTTAGGANSAIYYATNIKSGSDTVTVHLSVSSAYIEVYLAEDLTGVNTASPIDAHVGATGAAGAVSSGNATTTVAGDIIYGYCVGDSACTAGAGFASRSTLDGNLVEDMTAGNPGAYAATGSANSSWSMKMVALKPATATITSATTANGTVGGSFSYQITASITPTSYGATGLPGRIIAQRHHRPDLRNPNCCRDLYRYAECHGKRWNRDRHINTHNPSNILLCADHRLGRPGSASSLPLRSRITPSLATSFWSRSTTQTTRGSPRLAIHKGIPSRK